MSTLLRQVTILTYECWVCGVPFGLSQAIARQREADGETFFCSANGCRLAFGEGTISRLMREKARMESRLDRARSATQRAERQAAAYKGVATKLKKRASAGLCPCCNRTFQNLARHMVTKHPEVVESPEEQGK